MGLTKEKVLINIEKYGNTTFHGTIPLMSLGMGKQVKKGDSIILSSIWRRLHMGKCLFKMGILNIFIVN